MEKITNKETKEITIQSSPNGMPYCDPFNGCKIINSNGVRELLMLDLTEEEQAKLDNSCKIIKDMREKSIDKIIEES